MKSSKLNIKFITLFILGISWNSMLLAEAPKFDIPSVNRLSVWENIGLPGFTPSAGDLAPIVVDSNDVPYVAYTDTSNSNKITVKKFDGMNWVSVGADGFSDGQAGFISLSIDSRGTPFVSYMDRAYSDKLTVQRFDSISGWTVVGTTGFSTEAAYYSSITHDDSYRPYVVYREATSGNTVVKMYNSSAWVNVGTLGTIAWSAGDFSIEIGSMNVPYLGYSTSAGANVMSYADGNWTSVGSAGFSDGSANFMSMALDSGDRPYVFYRDSAHQDYATAMKYDGSVWTTVGEAGFSDAYVGSMSPYIDVDSQDIPYVIYQSVCSKATVQKYDGTQWLDVGKSCFSEATVLHSSIALSSDDVPYVAYIDRARSNTITVKKATAYLKFDVAENLIAVGDINATDNEDDPITYSITGDESAFFEINSTTGVLSFKVAPDYETPQDANGDNVYDFSVMISANGDDVSKLIRVNVLDAGEIISDGGLTTATISLNENIAIATTVLGGGSLTLSGLDAASFHINEDTQELIFNTTPDYEVKSSYEVVVTAEALGQSDTQTITININDVSEAPRIQMNADWRTVGSASGLSASGATTSDIVIDSTGTPYIAFIDYAYTGKVSVKRYNNGTWNYVGSPGFSESYVGSYSLAFDNSNTLYIAFSVLSGSDAKAMVMKLDGTTWIDVGSTVLSSDISFISLSIDSNNIPYVFYSDGDNSEKATVMKYSTGIWTLVGSAIGSSDSGSINYQSIGRNSIILNSNDVPYIVYRRFTNTGPTIDVMKFNGMDWVDVNSSFSTNSHIANSGITIDHNDTLYMTYTNGTDYNSYAAVMRYSGRRWTHVGSDYVTDSLYFSSIELTFDSKNVPYLVYSAKTKSNRCCVIKYKDGIWEDVGTSAFSTGSSMGQSLVIDGLDTPYVVYSDEALSNKVIVQKLIPHYNILENSTFVTDITALDDEGDTIIYGINSGDSSYFDVATLLGILSFKTAPDFETPQSSSGTNTYEIVATASDNNGTTPQRIQVVVTDDPDTDNDGIEDSKDPDADGDGMPNDYEETHGFDPLEASDADEDYDDDGFTNLEEYNAGTHPKDDTSYPTVPQDSYIFLPAIIMYLLN